MKKILFKLFCVVMVFAMLSIPIKLGPYDDGGTVVYQAFLYRYIRWNHIMSTEGFYQGTELQWFPHNFDPLGEPNIE